MERAETIIWKGNRRPVGWMDEDETSLRRSLADRRAGRVIPWSEVKRQLGIVDGS